MGVKGLWQLIQPTGKPVTLESLEGKVLAVDVSIWLNQTMKGMRDRHGNPLPNAHLIGLYHRVCKLLFYRIKPIFVFDGATPALKKQTLAARRKKKEEAADSSAQASKKMVETMLKHHALQAVLQTASPEKSSNQGTVSSPKKSSNQGTLSSPKKSTPLKTSRPGNEKDLFQLPSTPMPLLSEVDRPEKYPESSEEDSYCSMPYSDLDIDYECEEFKALPPEIQHELLTDMKESRKRNSWANLDELPQDSNEFASYQMAKLMKQSNLSQKLEGVRKELNARDTGDIAASFADVKSLGSIEGRRLVSDDSSHYILIKGLKKANQKGLQEKISVMNESNSEEVEETISMKAEPEYKDDIVEINDSMTEEENCSDSMVQKTQVSSPEDVEIQAAIMESLKVTNQNTLSAMPSTSGITTGKRSLIEHDSNSVVKNNDMEGGFIHESDSEIEEAENVCTDPIQKKSLKKTTSPILVKSSYKSHDCASDSSEIEQKSHSPCLEMNSNIGESFNENDQKKQNIFPLTHSLREPGYSSVEEIKSMKPITVERKSFIFESFQKEEGISVSEEDVNVSKSSEESIDLEKAAEIVQRKRHSISVSENESSSESEDNFIEVKINVSDVKEDELFPASMFEPAGNISEKNELKRSPTKSDIKYTVEGSSVIDLETGKKKKSSSFVDLETGESLMMEYQNGLPDYIDTAPNPLDVLTREEMQEMASDLQSEALTLTLERGRQERMAATVTEQMVLEAQDLLALFGVPFVVSPTEAEAQCAYLNAKNLSQGSITDDSDIWLFGGLTVYKNFFNQNKQVELYRYSEIEKKMLLTRERMINLALVCGSDYTEGIEGIGPVTGMEILQEFKGTGIQPLERFRDWWLEAQENIKKPLGTSLKKKLRGVDIKEGFPSMQVVNGYLKPTVDESEEAFSWSKPDLDLLRLFALEKFGWTRSKSDETLLPMFQKLTSKQSQSHITNFFSIRDLEVSPRGVKSKRVKRVLNRMRNCNGDEDVNEESQIVKAVRGRGKMATNSQNVKCNNKPEVNFKLGARSRSSRGHVSTRGNSNGNNIHVKQNDSTAVPSGDKAICDIEEDKSLFNHGPRSRKARQRSQAIEKNKDICDTEKDKPLFYHGPRSRKAHQRLVGGEDIVIKETEQPVKKRRTRSNKKTTHKKSEKIVDVVDDTVQLLDLSQDPFAEDDIPDDILIENAQNTEELLGKKEDPVLSGSLCLKPSQNIHCNTGQLQEKSISVQKCLNSVMQSESLLPKNSVRVCSNMESSSLLEGDDVMISDVKIKYLLPSNKVSSDFKNDAKGGKTKTTEKTEVPKYLPPTLKEVPSKKVVSVVKKKQIKPNGLKNKLENLQSKHKTGGIPIIPVKARKTKSKKVDIQKKKRFIKEDAGLSESSSESD